MNRLLAAVAVFASGSLYAADPPKPFPAAPAVPFVTPQVVTPPIVSQPTRPLPAADLVATFAKDKPAGERFSFVSIVIVHVPHDFAETAGLTVDPKKMTRQWALSAREAKLLSALLLADKRCDILSHPQLCLADAQTGFFQVAQTFDVLGPLTITEEKGEKVAKAKVTQQAAGITLRLTPTIAADANAMTLKAEMQCTRVSGQPVAMPTEKADGSFTHTPLTLASLVVVGNGQTATAFDSTTIQSKVSLASGETVVLGGLTAHGKATGEKPGEVLFIVQGAIGVGTKK